MIIYQKTGKASRMPKADGSTLVSGQGAIEMPFRVIWLSGDLKQYQELEFGLMLAELESGIQRKRSTEEEFS